MVASARGRGNRRVRSAGPGNHHLLRRQYRGDRELDTGGLSMLAAWRATSAVPVRDS